MLIPLYVLVGVWGGAGRLTATLKFVIYTMAGSLLMLAAIVAYGISEGTFDLVDGPTSSNEWLFLGFVAAFAVKAPLFPFHGWLPDPYPQRSGEGPAASSDPSSSRSPGWASSTAPWSPSGRRMSEASSRIRASHR